MEAAARVDEPRSRKWSEFLLTGGATPFVFGLAWCARTALGLDEAEFLASMVFYYAAHLINNPHFAATYLLFYRSLGRRLDPKRTARLQVARYVVSGFVVPLLLIFWIGYAFLERSSFALGLLLQLMFLLVGWHYAKQAFGVLVVLSARRGVRLAPETRVWALFHAFAGWAYAWASPAHESFTAEESGVLYESLAQPLWLERLTLAIFLVSTAGLAIQLVRSWKQVPPLGPLFGYLVTIWFWTVFTSLDPLVIYAIPALHSVQYLFFVYHLKRGSLVQDEFSAPPGPRLLLFALGSCVLGWLLLRGLPELLDGASRTSLPLGGALGATPYFAGFFAFVNIHHYFMDHVLWRRENPEMAVLFASR